ncbi:BatA domain-containing protein [Sediminitomix flava]|uniref:Putative membrane protein (TIGR02226 family) n=1 Tax=Sediminitomix flava TaxID=379075 RepID=A0A315YXT0_SEDFL|nr:BatA domain-containing protein [Sediminitomix flava]PWJ34102.1 putative membrane protein (TIGR02226 family) [Sediminitomix flava]
MSFLIPSALYALALLAIPIIIHLFNFQRAKKVYFTNVAFLKGVKQVTKNRNRLKHILILLSRMAFMACLIIAFARPILPVENGQEVNLGRNISVYLDNSFSMQNELSNQAVMDIGKDYVEQITNIFSDKGLYQLIDNSFSGNSYYFTESTRLKDKLAELDYSNISRGLQQVYDKQSNVLRSYAEAPSNQIFWISDFQKSSVGDLSALKTDTLNKFYIIPLSPDPAPNLFVDSVWLESPFIKARENNILHAKVVNSGTDDIVDRQIKLFVGDVQVSSSNVSIEAGSDQTIEMTFAVNQKGQHACRLSIEDYPITFDNDYFFVVKVAPQINIVAVTETDQGYLKGVYGNEDFFNLTVYTTKNVNYNALSEADLIILSNLPNINSTLSKEISKAFQKGKNIVVFPSEKADFKSYSASLGMNFKAVNQGGEPAQIGIQPPSEEIPFFKDVFEDVSPRMNMPQAAPVCYWNLRGNNLLKLRNDRPFFSEVPVGEGKLFLFASPLNNDFTNFHQHALFVPVMYNMAIGSKTKAVKLAYSFDGTLAKVDVKDLKPNDVVKLTHGETELIPAQKIFANSLTIDIPKGKLPAGIYEVKSAETDLTYNLVAFNYPREESLLDYYTTSELQKIFESKPNVQVFSDLQQESFTRTFSEKNKAQPLWRYFLIASILFLIIEVLIIRFWKTT